MSNQPTRVALFVTCLVDLFRPEVGEAAVALLERQGLRVEFPMAQTCCGAPAYHSGWQPEAVAAAKHWIEVFEPYEAIVSPSPVCVAVVRRAYPELLAGDPAWQHRAQEVAKRTYELAEFLVERLGVTETGSSFQGKVAYQPACQQRRVLQTDAEARALLAAVPGAERVPLPDAESCCGFGGMFSVQMPHLADAMGERKAKAIEASGAEVVVSGETGCVLHLADLLRRRGSTCRAVHLAEILASGIS